MLDLLSIKFANEYFRTTLKLVILIIHIKSGLTGFREKMSNTQSAIL